MSLLIMAILVCGAAEGQEAPTDSTWNVMDFAAVADGTTDDTAAFQKALDAAGAAGGGIVLAPTGQYRFDGSLVVPPEVTLKGVYEYAPAHAGLRDKNRQRPEYGTTFRVHGGAGDEEGPPFIKLNYNSTLRGVVIFYPDQDRSAAPPTPYPFAIAMRDNNPAVIDVELLNPYKGIDASHNQRALIRNVHGQPLRMGVYVDSIYDIGRIENVHWNPWWSMEKDLFQWQLENGEAFVFGKTDWHYVLNTFCFGYNVGYKFIQTDRGATNGNFLGIGADRCMRSVLIEQSERYGILITNGEFVAFDPPDPTMVRIEKTHTGSVRFNNCAFWGPCDRIVYMDGPGTVGFSDCTFVHWGHHGDEPHAIHAEGGSIMVRGCEFQERKAQVYLGPGVDRAIISENFIRGPERMTNESKGEVVIQHNLSR
jgi:pectate lyase-like protein